jgi:hypothetical protein
MGMLWLASAHTLLGMRCAHPDEVKRLLVIHDAAAADVRVLLRELLDAQDCRAEYG